MNAVEGISQFIQGFFDNKQPVELCDHLAEGIVEVILKGDVVTKKCKECTLSKSAFPCCDECYSRLKNFWDTA